MNTQNIQDSLEWRYATKQFDSSKQIDPATWQILEESLHLAPSSLGLQLWHFIVVDSPDIRSQLRAVSWGQPQVTDASRYVVLCARKDITQNDLEAHIANIANVRHSDIASLKEYLDKMAGLIQTFSPEATRAWLESQVHIALGFILSYAALLKVDTCTIGGLDPQAYDRILGLENSPYHSVVAVALGYRNEEDKYASLPKVRFPKATVIEHK